MYAVVTTVPRHDPVRRDYYDLPDAVTSARIDLNRLAPYTQVGIYRDGLPIDWETGEPIRNADQYPMRSVDVTPLDRIGVHDFGCLCPSPCGRL